MSEFKNFVTPHCHIQSFDSASTPDRFCKKETELGTGFITVTDHGSMEITRAVYDMTKKNFTNLTPILGCLMPGQEIHTIDGLKKVEDIEVGDLVLTHLGRFRRVLRTMNRHFDGDVYTIYKSGNGEQGITLTGEHPVLIAQGGNKDPQWIKAEDIVAGKNGKAGRELSGSYNSYMLLPKLIGKVKSISVDTYLEPAGFTRLGGTVSFASKKINASTSWAFPRSLALTKDLSRFLGLHCAEGWTDKDSDGSAGLVFNVAEKEYVNFCVNFLKENFGIECSVKYRPERGSCDINYCHKPLATLLAGLCGVGAHNKKVPAEILQSRGSAYKIAFLDGLLDGDGKKGEDNTFKVASRDLVAGARLLMVHHGVFPTIKTVNGKLNGKNFTHHAVSFKKDAKWRRSFWVNPGGGGGGGRWRAAPIREVVKSHYSGNVYNFHVEEDNSYVSDCILHNCEAYFRDDSCPIFEKLGAPRSEDGTYRDHFKYCHITLHAMDEAAFFALSRILSEADYRAETHGKERKPLFTWANLEELGSYNITGSSGCLIGMVGRHLMANNDPKAAEMYYEKVRSCFKPGNFFVEVFCHKCDTNYESKVVVIDPSGKEERFSPKRKVMTADGAKGIYLDKLALEFQANPAEALKKHQFISAVMENRVFVERPTKMTISSIKNYEGFLKNECRVWSPDGHLQTDINRFVIDLANKHGDPILISDDSHFAVPEERLIQEIRFANMGWNYKFSESYHRRSSEEAWAYFRDEMSIPKGMFEGWIENSYAWGSKFKEFKFTPKNTLPVSFYPQDTLKHTISLVEKHGRMDWSDPKWTARLETEIDMLYKNGRIDLLPYFQIAEEVCDLYLRNGQLTGPGRGSAAGLGLSYLLNITHVEPLDRKLLMERFISPDRIAEGGLPDIDQDLPSRDLLVDPTDAEKGWLKERFGDHVAQISTDSKLKLKSAIKDVFRALHRDKPNYFAIEKEINILTKSLPPPPQGAGEKEDFEWVFGHEEHGVLVPGIVDTHPGLNSFSKKYPREWATIGQLIGITKNKGRHAAGYVISDEPVHHFIPMSTVTGVRCTQYTKGAVEAAGAVKMDFLVTKILGDIQEAIRVIQDRHGQGVDWSLGRPPPGTSIPKDQEVPHIKIGKQKVPYVRCIPYKGGFVDVWNLPEEREVFADICRGEVTTVFQFDADAARKGLKHFRPVKDSLPLKSVEDLSLFTALARPGGLNALVTDEHGKSHDLLVEFARRARGEKPVGNIPTLDRFLPETYGICVFQESLQEIFRVFGKTTGIEANAFRSDIGKKRHAKVQKHGEKFLAAATPDLGIEAKQILDQILSWADYGFCKSHAISYAYVAYACAWLKHNYPLEWWCSVLKNATRDDVNNKFWKDCGHLVLLPDIQRSKENFFIEGDKIRAPFWLMKGVAEKAQAQVSELGDTQNVEQFVRAIEAWKARNARPPKQEGGKATKASSPLNKTVIRNLIIAGALDSLFPAVDESGLPITVADRLFLYDQAVRLVTGKTKTKKRKKIDDEEDSPDIEAEGSLDITDPLVVFQVRKTLLPAYTEPLFRLCESYVREKLVTQGREFPVFKFVDKEPNQYQRRGQEFSVISGEDFGILSNTSPVLGSGSAKLNIAMFAFVDSQRKFSYDKKVGTEAKRVEALSLSLDVDGCKHEVVRWPGKDGLPPEFQKDLTGCVVVVGLSKNPNEPGWFFSEMHVVAQPVSFNKSKEKSDESNTREAS